MMAESSRADLPSHPQTGGEYLPSAPGTTLTAQMAADNRSGSLEEVPNVEVRENKDSVRPPGETPTPMAYTHLSAEQQKQAEEKMKKEQAKKYFSIREGAFEKAVDDCSLSVIDPVADGNILSSWLLTEIDHWDHEKERIVILTEKQLVIVKYNFIGVRVEDHRKIPLIRCDKVQTGRFVYPKNTMMMLSGYAENSPRLKENGVRVIFGHFEPSLLQSWNPWSTEIPYVTFTSHMLSHLVDTPPSFMLVKGFQKALVEALSGAHDALANLRMGNSLQVTEEEITIYVYLGVSAMINNQSKLGYCKDRGNVFW